VCNDVCKNTTTSLQQRQLTRCRKITNSVAEENVLYLKQTYFKNWNWRL